MPRRVASAGSIFNCLRITVGVSAPASTAWAKGEKQSGSANAKLGVAVIGVNGQGIVYRRDAV